MARALEPEPKLKPPIRMSPKPGSPCWLLPEPVADPLSEIIWKLRLVCWAPTWAALVIWLVQLAWDPRAVDAENGLLVAPPRLVPSGTRLIVTSSGWTHELPETA